MPFDPESLCPASKAGHYPSNDPRKNGACVRCGRPIPPEPWRITEPSAGAFYQELADTLEAGWEEECSIRRPALERFFRLGYRQYGDAYLLRNNAAEGQDEACDGTNYCLMESHRLLLEDLDPGDVDACRALLFESALEFAKAYEKLSDYSKRLHEARSMVPKGS